MVNEKVTPMVSTDTYLIKLEAGERLLPGLEGLGLEEYEGSMPVGWLIELVSFGRPIVATEALEELDRLRYRPADPTEFSIFRREYPEVPVPVMGLYSPRRGGEPVFFSDSSLLEKDEELEEDFWIPVIKKML